MSEWHAIRFIAHPNAEERARNAGVDARIGHFSASAWERTGFPAPPRRLDKANRGMKPHPSTLDTRSPISTRASPLSGFAECLKFRSESTPAQAIPKRHRRRHYVCPLLFPAHHEDSPESAVSGELFCSVPSGDVPSFVIPRTIAKRPNMRRTGG